MKKLLLAIAILFLAIPCLSQDQNYENFVAAGMSFNQHAEPNIAGNLLYAHKMNEEGSLYSFNFIDLVSKDKDKFIVGTSITAGIAKKLVEFGRAKVFGTTGVGILAGGENVGYSWTSGGAVVIPLGKGWQALPNIRIIKSSLTEFEGIYSFMLGWGK